MEYRTDSDLVAAARTGNNDAFGMLVERYQGMACHIARRMLSSDDLAHELAQEAFLQAYLSLDALLDAERFRSWLYGIVLNVCRGFLRRERDVPLSLEELSGGRSCDLEIAENGASPEQIAEAHELQGAVMDAVSSLSPSDRTTTLLFYYQQMSLDDIATLLGISVTAVKGRLFKARRRLRNQLEPYSGSRRIKRMSEQPANAVPLTIADLRHSRNQDGTASVIVILSDQLGQRLLPIWIGPHEGEIIRAGLQQTATARPLTVQLMADLLKASHSEVESVRIEALKGDVFYAVIRLMTGSGMQEIDARPSDAIALAVYSRIPILASPAVLEAVDREGTGNRFLEYAKAHDIFVDETAAGSLLGKELAAIMGRD